MAASLDLSGVQLPLTVRVGATVVVRLRDWTDDSGVPVNFVGGTFDGSVSRRGETSSASTPLSFVIQGLGAVDVLLPATTGWDAGSFFVPKPNYNYIVWFTDSQGVREPQIYGPISVAAGAPE